MTREQFLELGIDEAFELAYQNSNYLWYEETLLDFAKSRLPDYIEWAIHVLEAVRDSESQYYYYDATAGTFDTPTPLKTVEDIEKYMTFDD